LIHAARQLAPCTDLFRCGVKAGLRGFGAPFDAAQLPFDAGEAVFGAKGTTAPLVALNEKALEPLHKELGHLALLERMAIETAHSSDPPSWHIRQARFGEGLRHRWRWLDVRVVVSPLRDHAVRIERGRKQDR
jgi:hypothetical protein